MKSKKFVMVHFKTYWSFDLAVLWQTCPLLFGMSAVWETDSGEGKMFIQNSGIDTIFEINCIFSDFFSLSFPFKLCFAQHFE